jgi:hypothetical protein
LTALYSDVGPDKITQAKLSRAMHVVPIKKSPDGGANESVGIIVIGLDVDTGWCQHHRSGRYCRSRKARRLPCH